MYGKFYGVGVGPGDPLLLTLKAVNVIKNCEIIGVPNSGAGENTALNIISEYVNGKKIIKCSTPMTKDAEVLKLSHEKISEEICSYLKDGKDFCFITLGDPSIYSTFSYIHELVIKSGYETYIVPGITSFSAVAAALKTPLCEGREPLHIIPASYEGLDMGLKLSGTKVLMKSGKQLNETVELLSKYNLIENSKMVSCCTMKNEVIYEDLNNIDVNNSYFTTIIVKEESV